MPTAFLALVFSKCNIKYPMQGVFDTPMFPDAFADLLRVWGATANVQAGFGFFFP